MNHFGRGLSRSIAPLSRASTSVFSHPRGGVAFRYSAVVIDHYENPRNVGTLDKKKDNVGTGLVGAPACGDVMKLQIEVAEDGTITDSKFKTFGCTSAIASSSLASTWIIGKNINDIKISNTDIATHLKLPPVKLHCSMLAEDAVKAAVYDIQQKRKRLAEQKAA